MNYLRRPGHEELREVTRWQDCPYRKRAEEILSRGTIDNRRYTGSCLKRRAMKLFHVLHGNVICACEG